MLLAVANLFKTLDEIIFSAIENSSNICVQILLKEVPMANQKHIYTLSINIKYIHLHQVESNIETCNNCWPVKNLLKELRSIRIKYFWADKMLQNLVSLPPAENSASFFVESENSFPFFFPGSQCYRFRLLWPDLKLSQFCAPLLLSRELAG